MPNEIQEKQKDQRSLYAEYRWTRREDAETVTSRYAGEEKKKESRRGLIESLSFVIILQSPFHARPTRYLAQ